MRLSKKFIREQIQGYEESVQWYSSLIKKIQNNLEESTGEKREAFAKLLGLARSGQEECRKELRRYLDGDV